MWERVIDGWMTDCWSFWRSAVASGNRVIKQESVHRELAQNGTATLHRDGSFLSMTTSV